MPAQIGAVIRAACCGVSRSVRYRDGQMMKVWLLPFWLKRCQIIVSLHPKRKIDRIKWKIPPIPIRCSLRSSRLCSSCREFCSTQISNWVGVTRSMSYGGTNDGNAPRVEFSSCHAILDISLPSYSTIPVPLLLYGTGRVPILSSFPPSKVCIISNQHTNQTNGEPVRSNRCF